MAVHRLADQPAGHRRVSTAGRQQTDLWSHSPKSRSTCHTSPGLPLSSHPQVIANAVVGGVTGKVPVGGGATIEHGDTGQSEVVCALCVGMVNRSLKRAEVSTSCTAAEFDMAVVKPNDPLRSKELVIPSPKWS